MLGPSSTTDQSRCRSERRTKAAAAMTVSVMRDALRRQMHVPAAHFPIAVLKRVPESLTGWAQLEPGITRAKCGTELHSPASGFGLVCDSGGGPAGSARRAGRRGRGDARIASVAIGRPRPPGWGYIPHTGVF